ncbi:MAG: AIPR family protein [Verrucomicrobia bacterium]|nr:AIPR family protein [Verrucomicrobiota bacterium]
MLNLNTFSTLHERVRKCQTDYILDDNHSAFMWLSLEAVLQLNSDEIEDAITDGGQDGGVDAIHISERTVNLFTFTYTDNFDNCSKNFPERDLDSFVLTAQGILQKSLQRTDVNEAVWDKATEIWSLFKGGHLSFKFYVCSNKLPPTEKARRKFETALQQFRFVEFHYLSQEDLVNKILERKFRRLNGQLTFIDKQYFERSDGQVKGVVATVAATDLVKLLTDPSDPKRINEDAFNENVRVYQKRNRINQHILETALSDENFEFWYLNNGITIVCEQCIYQPNTRSPRVTLTDFQIVNGGQTTHALCEAYEKDPAKLDNVLLLVRICEATRNNPIAEKICETTNSQTPVTTRDLHSNDRIQRKLEDEFTSLGYFYERKANQYLDAPTAKRLNNELLAQLSLAFYLDMPSEAKNSKTLVFGDKYDEIFNEEAITAERLLVPLRFYEPLQKMKKEIQRKKRRRLPINEREAFVSRAIFHILNVVRHVSEKENLPLDVEQYRQVLIEKAVQHIGTVVQKEQAKRGELYTHDKFFKETQTNLIIHEHIEEFYKQPALVSSQLTLIPNQ